MTTIVAMLISVTLVGSGTGVQSYTIQGFDNLQACRAAQPEVKAQFEHADKERRARGKPLVITTCVEVGKSGQASH
jgi:hypothetical protein